MMVRLCEEPKTNLTENSSWTMSLSQFIANKNQLI